MSGMTDLTEASGAKNYSLSLNSQKIPDSQMSQRHQLRLRSDLGFYQLRNTNNCDKN